MTPLRIAILADDLGQLADWERRLFDKLCRDSRFELAVVVLARRADSAANRTRPALLGIIGSIESAVSKTRGDEAGKAFEAALKSAEIVSLEPMGGDVTRLKPLAIDVMLNHSAGGVDSAIPGMVRFGVWSLDCRTDGTGFREVIERAPVTSVALSRQTAENKSREIIACAHFNTARFCVRNRDRIREFSVSLAWRELVRLAETGRVGAEESRAAAPAPTGLPSTVAVLGYCANAATQLAAGAGRIIARRIGLRPHMWTLFYGSGSPFDAAALAQCVEAPPAKGELWADPFLLLRDGVTYVFFENYSYGLSRAKISVARLDRSGLTVLGDALDLPHHLSFPFVFESGGETFLIPESSAARCVEVWRAVDFPLRWERHARALEGQAAADTVLFKDGDHWWMLSNLSEGPIEDFCNELHVFSVDGPALRRVVAHPLNPVVIDSRTARNAGRVFRSGGRLLRTSQNNAHGEYGWGLNLMEITQLDMKSYEERRLQTITPDFRPGLIGCHHADMAGGLFIIDGCRRYG